MKEKPEKKEQRVIKRYRNRKLYDTYDSCYVTLEDIADLVRDGEEITVIDNNSKEDLTRVTLAQIIFEEEKRKKEFLPLNTLTDLIRTGGDAIKGLVQKSIGGSVKEIHNLRGEIHDHLEKMIHKGTLSHDEGNKFLGVVKDFIGSKIKPTVENVQNIPTVQSEVKSIKQKLADLEKELKSFKTEKKSVNKKK